METLTHLYIYATCSLVNVILHSTGLFLLLRSYKGKHKTVQHLCIINLSLTELVRNILGLLGDIYFLVDIFAEMKKSFQIAGDYMWYVSFTCMHYLFVFSMFLVLGDRLMASTLSRLRYKSVCVVYRQKLIVAAWCFCTLVCLPAVSAVFFVYNGDKLREMKIYRVIRAYIPSLLNVLLCIFACVSYMIMFAKYKRETGKSLLCFARHPKFFMSVLLLGSFVVFTLVPYVVGTLPYVVGVQWTGEVYKYVNISTILSDTADVVIYLSLYPPVQFSFLRRLASRGTANGAKYILLMTTKKKRVTGGGSTRGKLWTMRKEEFSQNETKV